MQRFLVFVLLLAGLGLAGERRIAEFRLPIWRLMLIQAFGRHGQVLSLPTQWSYRPEAEGADVAQDISTATGFAGWKQVRIPTVSASEYDKGGGHGAGCLVELPPADEFRIGRIR